MADSGSGAGKVQDVPETPVPESKVVLKYQWHWVKEHRSQLNRLPLTEIGNLRTKRNTDCN